jgi:hypothetical protein
MAVKTRAQLRDELGGIPKQRVVNTDLVDSMTLAQTRTFYICTGAVNLANPAFTDVTGLTTGAFTPAAAETVTVDAMVIVDASAGTGPNAAGDTATVELQVDGAANAQTFIGKAAAANGTYTIPCRWTVALTAGVAHTLKISAQGSAAKGAVTVSSWMSVLRQDA